MAGLLFEERPREHGFGGMGGVGAFGIGGSGALMGAGREEAGGGCSFLLKAHVEMSQRVDAVDAWGSGATGAVMEGLESYCRCTSMLTYAHVCSRMLTYAHVC